MVCRRFWLSGSGSALQKPERYRCNSRYGILPQLTADFTSTIIYRFDMNLRDATVLGLVGAGGIGAPLIFAMSSYRWNEVGAILLGLIVLVLIIEWISARIRVKLARG